MRDLGRGLLTSDFREGFTGDREEGVLLASDAVEGTVVIWYAGVQVGPELDEEKGAGRAAIVQVLQPAFLVRKFVIDLSNIHYFELRV